MLEPIAATLIIYACLAFLYFAFALYASTCWQPLNPVEIDYNAKRIEKDEIFKRKKVRQESAIEKILENRKVSRKLRSESATYGKHEAIVATSRSDAALASRNVHTCVDDDDDVVEVAESDASPHRIGLRSIKNAMKLSRGNSAVSIPLLSNPSPENRWRVFGMNQHLLKPSLESEMKEAPKPQDLQPQLSIHRTESIMNPTTEALQLSSSLVISPSPSNADGRGSLINQPLVLGSEVANMHSIREMPRYFSQLKGIGMQQAIGSSRGIPPSTVDEGVLTPSVKKKRVIFQDAAGQQVQRHASQYNMNPLPLVPITAQSKEMPAELSVQSYSSSALGSVLAPFGGGVTDSLFQDVPSLERDHTLVEFPDASPIPKENEGSMHTTTTDVDEIL